MDAVVGTCGLCGQEMIRDGDDAWHPWNVKVLCPPEPEGKMNTQDSYQAWQDFYRAGLRPGRPGVEHFREV